MLRIIRPLYAWLAKVTFSNCFNALAQLQHAYFACYTQSDYLVRQAHYEKKIYQKRATLLHRITCARDRLKKNKKMAQECRIIFSRIERVSEIVFSLNQLRFRVSDYALFDMCGIEMQALDKASTIALKNAANFFFNHKKQLYFAELLNAIHALEALFHRALQIASPEPILFLFFIQDLYALYYEISK